MEASASWMEDAVFPQVKDYLNYIGLRYEDTNDNGRWDKGEIFYDIDGTIAGIIGRRNSWFDYPENPLDTRNNSYEYGTVIWAKYLSERFGVSVIRGIWSNIENGMGALDATATYMNTLGTSIEDEYPGFMVANLLRDYADGADYPRVLHENAFSEYPQAVSGQLDHLAGRFILLKSDGMTKDTYVTFYDMHSGNLSASILLKTVSGSQEQRPVALNSGQVSVLLNGFDFTPYERASVVIANRSAWQDSVPFSVEISSQAPSPPMKISGEGGGGGGCFIASATGPFEYNPSLHRMARWFEGFRCGAPQHLTHADEVSSELFYLVRVVCIGVLFAFALAISQKAIVGCISPKRDC